MSGGTAEVNRYVPQWWLWFGIALFLLVPLDLLTTLIAVAKYGVGVEANPVMQWLLRRGLFVVIAVHLGVLSLAVSLFHIAIGGVRNVSRSQARVFVHVVNIWIGVLLVVGIVVVANNVFVLI